MRRLLVVLLAAACTSCSLGSDDATIVARYDKTTLNSTVQSVRRGTAAKGALLGGALSGFASFLIMGHHQAKPVIIITATVDAVAVALWAEDEIYRTGAVIAREHACPRLLAREDLRNVGMVIASTAVDRKTQIEELLDSHVMADQAPLGRLISPLLPTYSVMDAGLVSQIAPSFSDIGGVWGIFAAVAFGAGINSVVLLEVATIANDYYEEKAKRVCK